MAKIDIQSDLTSASSYITETNPQQSNQKQNNRRSLLLLLAVFVLPILLAKLALDNQWLSLGVTNQGKLLDQPLTLNDLGINEDTFSKQWLIIYHLPNECAEICLQSIETAHSSYVLLGKDMPRVTPLLLSGNIFTAGQKKQLFKSQWHMLSLTPQMNKWLKTPQVIIADPLGNIILKHTIPNKHQELRAFGKAIVDDMKKLLKYSKVG
jgi:hypothetical protein